MIQRTRRKHLPRLGSPLSAELKEFVAMFGRDTDFDADNASFAVAFPAGFYVFSVLLFGTWHYGFSRNEKPPRRAAVLLVACGANHSRYFVVLVSEHLKVALHDFDHRREHPASFVLGVDFALVVLGALDLGGDNVKGFDVMHNDLRYVVCFPICSGILSRFRLGSDL